jgi:hypothetical protein
MALDNIDTPLEVLLIAFAAIGLVFGAWKAVRAWADPALRLAKRVEALEEHSKTDHVRLSESEASSKVIIRALLALLENARTDNSTGKIAEAERELEEYLISR